MSEQDERDKQDLQTIENANHLTLLWLQSFSLNHSTPDEKRRLAGEAERALVAFLRYEPAQKQEIHPDPRSPFWQRQ